MSVFHDLPRSAYPGAAFEHLAVEPGFSIGTARALVWLAQLAYETDDTDKVASILSAWGIGGRSIGGASAGQITAGATARGIIAESSDALLIAVAGTDVLVPGDYVTDAAFAVGSDHVHSGFAAAADVIWPDVSAAALAAQAARRPIFVTGHSLGGAIAAIIAARLASAGAAPTAVYGFGIPRLGHRGFADPYNAALGAVTYRLVHGLDPVAAVPPLALGYRHVGRMLGCPSGGAFSASNLASGFLPDEPSAIPSSAASFWQRIRGLLPSLRPGSSRSDWVGVFLGHLPPTFADHFMDRYLEAVERSV